MRKSFCALAALTLALCMLFSCAENSVPYETETESESDTETATESETITESETEEETESESESVTESESASETQKSSGGGGGTWSPLTDTQRDCDFVYEMQEIERLYSSVVLKENRSLTSAERTAYLRKITFLGDSTTNGMRLFGLLPDGYRTTQVWYGPHGTITLSNVNKILITYPDEGVEMTVAQAAAKKKPEIMVITLGVNGISFMNESSFKYTFNKLIADIRSVSPRTKIILQSIYPICKSYGKQGSINQFRIARANRWLAETAVNNGTYYLNTAISLALEDGYLPSSYHTGDGLHPNKTCYRSILDYIVTHPIPGYARVVETVTETAAPATETAAVTETQTESVTETVTETETITETVTESESQTESESESQDE